MKHIDENQLETDAQYRYEYLCEFMGFGPDDVGGHSRHRRTARPRLALVERTYNRLLAYDATARHFVPRQHGYGGEVPRNPCPT